MGKRGAAQSLSEKAAKQAKAKATPTAVEALLAECRNDAAAESYFKMMKEAVPYALMHPGERHSFQADILGCIDDLAATEEQRRSQALEEARAAVRALEDEKAEAAAIASQLQAVIDKKLEEKTFLEAASKTSLQAVEQARESLDGARRSEVELKAARDEAVAQQGALQTLTQDMWEPLKAGSITGGLEQARAVKKFAASLAACVEGCATVVPESLASSISLALKTPPSGRGEFAATVLTHAETIFQDVARELAERIVSIDAGIAEAAKATAVAEEVEKAAQGDAEQKGRGATEAANAWVEADEKLVMHRYSGASFASRSAAASKAVFQAEEYRRAFGDLMSAWKVASQAVPVADPSVEAAPTAGQVVEPAGVGEPVGPAEPTEPAETATPSKGPADLAPSADMVVAGAAGA